MAIFEYDSLCFHVKFVNQLLSISELSINLGYRIILADGMPLHSLQLAAPKTHRLFFAMDLIFPHSTLHAFLRIVSQIFLVVYREQMTLKQ